MKKLIVLFFVCMLVSNTFAQNLGALLAPIPGSDVIEYIQVKFQLDPATEKIQNVTISNGNISEKLNREFKSEVDLYNFLGRAGWSFVSETKKEDKTAVNYSVSFSRKIQANNRMMGPNGMPQRPNIDSLRRAQQMRQGQGPQGQAPAMVPAQSPAPAKEKKK